MTSFAIALVFIVGASPPPARAAAPAPTEPQTSVFRFYRAGLVLKREAIALETWTLRRTGGETTMLVERKGLDAEWVMSVDQGATLYRGAASDDGKVLTLVFFTDSRELTLTCKRGAVAVAAANAVRDAPEARQVRRGVPFRPRALGLRRGRS